jgi:branched-chain amino acid transport system permease protein
VLGAVVFFVLQQVLAPYGAWYLVVLGVVAVVAALFARRGLWGIVTGGRDIRLFPTGHRVRHENVEG